MLKAQILYIMDFIYYAMPTNDLPPPEQPSLQVRSRYIQNFIYPQRMHTIGPLISNEAIAQAEVEKLELVSSRIRNVPDDLGELVVCDPQAIATLRPSSKRVKGDPVGVVVRPGSRVLSNCSVGGEVHTGLCLLEL